MKIEITEKMRKQAEKGKSVLKAGRIGAGGAKGAIIAGLIFLIFGILIGLPFLLSGSRGWILFLVIFGFAVFDSRHYFSDKESKELSGLLCEGIRL